MAYPKMRATEGPVLGTFTVYEVEFSSSDETRYGDSFYFTKEADAREAAAQKWGGYGSPGRYKGKKIIEVRSPRVFTSFAQAHAAKMASYGR